MTRGIFKEQRIRVSHIPLDIDRPLLGAVSSKRVDKPTDSLVFIAVLSFSIFDNQLFSDKAVPICRCFSLRKRYFAI